MYICIHCVYRMYTVCIYSVHSIHTLYYCRSHILADILALSKQSLRSEERYITS